MNKGCYDNHELECVRAVLMAQKCINKGCCDNCFDGLNVHEQGLLWQSWMGVCKGCFDGVNVYEQELLWHILIGVCRDCFDGLNVHEQKLLWQSWNLCASEWFWWPEMVQVWAVVATINEWDKHYVDCFNIMS